MEIIIKGKAKIPEGTMEDFKRPDHPDFATSHELKAMNFTGVRHNKLTSVYEIWTHGDIRARVTDECSEELWAKTYQDVFGIDVAVISK